MCVQSSAHTKKKSGNLYMYILDLALNNQQCLICNKTKPKQTKRLYEVKYSYQIEIMCSQFYSVK